MRHICAHVPLNPASSMVRAAVTSWYKTQYCGLSSGCQCLEGDLPEPRRRVRVERVGGDALTGAGLAWSCLVAVFEVAAADSLAQRRGREQHRGCGALLWGLPVEAPVVVFDVSAGAFQVFVGDVALQV